MQGVVTITIVLGVFFSAWRCVQACRGLWHAPIRRFWGWVGFSGALSVLLGLLLLFGLPGTAFWAIGLFGWDRSDLSGHRRDRKWPLPLIGIEGQNP